MPAAAQLRSCGPAPRITMLLLAGAVALHGSTDAVRDPDALDATRRALEELSRPRADSAAPADEGDVLVVPPLEEGTPVRRVSVPNRRAQAERLRERKASENWLLEALRREQDRSAGAGTENNDRAAAGLLPPGRANSDWARQTPPRPTDGLLDASVNEKAATNPLDQFMGAWMTPSDYRLLQGPREAENTAEGRGLGRGLKSPAFELSAPPPRGASRHTELSNPFLESFLPQPAGSDASDRRPADTMAPPAPPIPPRRAPPPQPAWSPPASQPPPAKEQWQPPAGLDEKYFPQLKKF